LKRILIVIVTFLLLTSIASAATLEVGSKFRYKTIQSAVNAAKDGDTIKVSSGIYKENVKITKYLKIYGTRYPKVYGIECVDKGGCTINGFSFTKKGVICHYAGGNNLIRNNYFTNCGIDISGIICSNNSITNNKITGGTISLCETWDNVVTGNTVTKSKVAFYMYEYSTCSKITKNIFSYNDVAVLVPLVPDELVGNKYIKNKVNVKIEK
jgi:parallel beta-helix repeat protein